MATWWKRWAERLLRSAVPIDGDSGAWSTLSNPRRRTARKVRPGRLEARTVQRLASHDSIERSVWRDLQLPPPAA
jgi:hypothetical protein